MKQLDLFEETLEKKIHRMEKWFRQQERKLFVMQEEITLLKQVYEMSKRANKFDRIKKTIHQIDMFGT